MSVRAVIAAIAVLVLVAAPQARAAPGEGAQPPAPPAAAKPPGGMVLHDGGRYRAGALTGARADTVNYHRVHPFLLDETEVTVAAYGECVKAGKCKPAPATVEMELREPELSQASARCNRDRPDRADHPVNCVDWNHAAAYCAWAGKHLPSEEEWEWAARNREKGTAYPWGSEPPGPQLCWNGDGNDAEKGRRDGTCAAGSHPAGDSASGVKDLAGNVWEWTSSRDVVGADSRGRGGSPAKVARGGGWAENDARAVSSSFRLIDLLSRRRPDLGFRCAKNP